ncbi:hypothetical protein CCR75_004389 [Bremia lactucae]|uniref:60S acidic ribosomal protein P2 n=1 Tax=Bremia lactucae TaxID=4779 RepID=A0A976FLX7_BRELC|nr:hypothetical protein CCR75_004389 [Bremia lactucae]
MRYIAAYLLAVLGGHPSPSEQEVERILNAAGVEVDKARVTAVVKAMEGKTTEEVIAAGSEKLAKFGSGAAAAAPTAGGGAGEETKDSKADDLAEEEEVDMGAGNMFGDDDDY